MKRLVLPIVFIFILSSCGKLSAYNVRPSFDSDSMVTVRYMQSEFTARIILDGNLNITAEIRQPDILSGVTVECSENGVKAICGDVEIDSSDGYFPFAELHKVINYINCSEPFSMQKNNEKFTSVYNNNNERYTVITDSEGKIEYINTPTCEFRKR